MAKRADSLRRVITKSGLAADQNLYTGPEGELVYVTDTDEVRVHDGIIAGGILVGSSGIGLPFKGALVTLAADETTADYTTATAVPLDAEVYDIGGWHDNSTNNSRMTVPSGVSRVRLVANVSLLLTTADEWVQLEIRKNGATDYQGSANTFQEVGRGSDAVTVASPSLDVVETDYFEMFLKTQSDTSITVSDDISWFSIEAVEGIAPATTPRGALVNLAADETNADYSTATAIPFDAEVRDTDAIHDNSTNNSRLTVPSGVAHVRLTAGVVATGHNSTEFIIIELRKNGTADIIGMPNVLTEVTSTEMRAQIVSGILEVVAGDYFEVFLDTENDQTITLNNDLTWFDMEIITIPVVAQARHRGALVHMIADETTADYTTSAAIAWDKQAYDTDSIHSVSVNNSRLTVPSGVSRIIVSGSVRGSLFAVDKFANVVILKNGSVDWVGAPGGLHETGSGSLNINLVSPVLEVIAGDYFEYRLGVETDTSITLDNDRSWFAMEIKE